MDTERKQNKIILSNVKSAEERASTPSLAVFWQHKHAVNIVQYSTKFSRVFAN